MQSAQGHDGGIRRAVVLELAVRTSLAFEFRAAESANLGSCFLRNCFKEKCYGEALASFSLILRLPKVGGGTDPCIRSVRGTAQLLQMGISHTNSGVEFVIELCYSNLL